MTFYLNKYQEIQEFIAKYRQNNDYSTKIIAISKNKSLISIEQAISHGVRIFGENKVQEAISKFSLLKNRYGNIELHMTGSLQRNKVKDAIDIFDVFQTLDREKLATEFIKYLEPKNKKKFFIQVNIGGEKHKSGISVINSDEFIKYCCNDLKMNILGLMCIPPFGDDPEYYFKKLKKISFRNNLQYLSMGMSSDYKFAIKVGATHIRIGTLLFGKR